MKALINATIVSAALLAGTIANATAMVVMTGSGAAPIGPARSETVTISVIQNQLSGLGLAIVKRILDLHDSRRVNWPQSPRPDKLLKCH